MFILIIPQLPWLHATETLFPLFSLTGIFRGSQNSENIFCSWELHSNAQRRPEFWLSINVDLSRFVTDIEALSNCSRIK